MARDRGLTLIELLLVTALLAAGAVVATPLLTEHSAAWEARRTAGELAGALRHARAEATARNHRVTLCRSPDGEHCPWEPSNPPDPGGWERGWILFVEHPAGMRQVLQIRRFDDPRIQATGNTPVRDYVSFTGLGAARRRHGGLQIGTLSVCGNRNGYAIVLSRSGRIRLHPTTCAA
jgi:type IV fimbrial biogenesis protein FimT